MSDVLNRTHRSFSFQWNHFPEIVETVEIPLFQQYLFQDEGGQLKNARGLDVGCGFGRYTYVAAKHYGARMVGVDLSNAVEAAWRNTKDLKNVDIVQADIYHLPFKKEAFDFAFTLGVLHHLPDPRGGFDAIVPLVKSGGKIWVKVYHTLPEASSWYKGLRSLRRITTRLPVPIVYGASVIFAFLERLLFHLPYRILRCFPLTERLAQRCRFKGHADYPIRRLWADWLDNLSVPLWKSYTQEEVAGWFERYPRLKMSIPALGWDGRMLIHKQQ
jgi:SAM-dependent methyltransferase